MNPQTVHERVTEYAELTGVAPLAPHELRRTFVTLSGNGGAQLGQIKTSPGHARVQTTERYGVGPQPFTDAPADRIGLRVKRD